MNQRQQGEEPLLTPQDLELLVQLFQGEAGLEFPRDTENVLQRKLQERLKILKIRYFSEYIRLLRSPGGQRELEHALDEVTTHETYFFREEYQLRTFQQELLPQIRAMAEGRQRLTLWSAGCSTGEEAYTLAMLVNSSDFFNDWSIHILGSDISRRCIQIARRGVYGKSSFRTTIKGLEDRYFTKENGLFTIRQEIRDQCLFLHANLLDPERHIPLGRMEAIFCRNVLIYLSQEARQRVLQLLYDRLQPGGYLLLGHSESLLHTESAFEVVHLNNDVVYRRPERDDGRRPSDRVKGR